MIEYVMPASLGLAAAVFGIYTRYTFVKKKDVYKPGGMSYYVYRDECTKTTDDTNRQLRDIHRDIKKLDQCLSRIEGRLNGNWITRSHEKKDHVP